MPAHHCIPLPGLAQGTRPARSHAVAALAACLFFGNALAASPADNSRAPSSGEQAPSSTGIPSVASGVVHHLVIARLKPDVNKTQAQEIREASVKLLRDIPGVLDVTTGVKLRDDRPVHLRDYDMVIHVLLDSAASLDGYAGHPLHKEFLARHGASIARYQVLDYVESP